MERLSIWIQMDRWKALAGLAEETVQLTVRGGWGYRDYRRFEFDPSRNENVWQAGTELRKRFNEHVSVAAVFDYDYFDSKNALFAAERYVGGIVVRFEN